MSKITRLLSSSSGDLFRFLLQCAERARVLFARGFYTHVVFCQENERETHVSENHAKELRQRQIEAHEYASPLLRQRYPDSVVHLRSKGMAGPPEPIYSDQKAEV